MQTNQQTNGFYKKVQTIFPPEMIIQVSELEAKGYFSISLIQTDSQSMIELCYMNRQGYSFDIISEHTGIRLDFFKTTTGRRSEFEPEYKYQTGQVVTVPEKGAFVVKKGAGLKLHNKQFEPFYILVPTTKRDPRKADRRMWCNAEIHLNSQYPESQITLLAA